MKDTHKRSISKTLTYRISSSILTGVVAYIFTNRLDISLFIGGMDMSVKLIWYYLHERVWNKVRWGKIKK